MLKIVYRFNLLLLAVIFSIAFIPTTFADEQTEEEPPKIDINSADVETLDKELFGIGPKKAAAIVEYREENGLFEFIHDIMKVKGIGEKTLETNRDKIVAIIPDDCETETLEEDGTTSEENNCEVENTEEDLEQNGETIVIEDVISEDDDEKSDSKD
ncbi:MAG: ComEA family DNA-binding protein [Thiomargarita sp.]|nr:ComEA family DNA-binding protein [Thiomargarita sp.]